MKFNGKFNWKLSGKINKNFDWKGGIWRREMNPKNDVEKRFWGVGGMRGGGEEQREGT